MEAHQIDRKELKKIRQELVKYLRRPYHPRPKPKPKPKPKRK